MHDGTMLILCMPNCWMMTLYSEDVASGCMCCLAAAVRSTVPCHQDMFTLQVQSQCLCSTNQLLCQTWNQLVEVLKAIGSFEEALSCCKRVLDMLHSAYPSNSTAVGYQRLQLAELLRHVGAGTEAEDEYAEAMKILHLHFGVSYAVSMHNTLH